MNDEPHVGSVDAHAERDGRDDDVGPFAEERILVAAALVVRQAGVIGQRGDADPVSQAASASTSRRDVQ